MSTDNRVTQEQIEALISSAETQEHIFWDKELIVSYKLGSGFTIAGRSACVDPANFDIEIGRSLCREDAERQLWTLEGYVLQSMLGAMG
jgi:Phage protein (N4 Gp49/phage Sf6 gene 66) family